MTLFVLGMAAMFLIGLLVGRWWTLFAAVAWGALMAVVIEAEESPAWYVGLAHAVAAATVIVVGVAIHTLWRMAARARNDRQAPRPVV